MKKQSIKQQGPPGQGNPTETPTQNRLNGIDPELIELNQADRVVKPIISYGMAVAIAISVVLNATNTLQGWKRDEAIATLAAKPPPTLVQTPDGNSIQVAPIAHNDRTSKSIKKFVKQSFWGLFNMSGKLIDEKGKLVDDPGRVANQEGQKVTSVAFVTADGVLSPTYQVYFLAELASITPQEIFDEDLDVVATLRFNSVGSPQAISPGHWQVRVVSYLKEKESQYVRKVTILNRNVYVRAIAASDDNPFASTPTERAIAAMTAGRLEIYRIEEF